jgi:hypothetical protein
MSTTSSTTSRNCLAIWVEIKIDDNGEEERWVRIEVLKVGRLLILPSSLRLTLMILFIGAVLFTYEEEMYLYAAWLSEMISEI